MDGYMGMPYEDLIRDPGIEDYTWEMDGLYVQLPGDRWYWVGLKNWTVNSWERI